MTKILTCNRTGLPFVYAGGNKRLLASIPSNGKMKAMLKPYKASGNPVLPRSEWFALSRRDQFGGTDWILDQQQYGECVGGGGAGSLRRARVLGGGKDVKLSPGNLYSQINGGQDQGAVISDALDALMKNGVCTFATVGIDPIFSSQQPAAATQECTRFRVAEGYHCASFDELVSALLLIPDAIAFYGYQVGSNFENFDKFGVAGHARGPGNHCNGADGIALLNDGRWVLDDFNSWGYSWGPFGNGRVYIDEE